jgi:hypothetical protein
MFEPLTPTFTQLFTIGPAGGASDLVDDRALEGAADTDRGLRELACDRKGTVDRDAAVVGAGRFRDDAAGEGAAGLLADAGRIAVTAPRAIRTGAALEILGVIDLESDHSRVLGRQRLIVLRAFCAALDVRAVRVRDE